MSFYPGGIELFEDRFLVEYAGGAIRSYVERVLTTLVPIGIEHELDDVRPVERSGGLHADQEASTLDTRTKAREVRSPGGGIADRVRGHGIGVIPTRLRDRKGYDQEEGRPPHGATPSMRATYME